MQVQNFFAQDANGNVVPGAVCRLYLAGTTTLATGLTDINNVPIGNPFTADGNGLVQFRAPNGAYDLNISARTLTTTLGIQFADTLQAIVELGAFLGPRATAPTLRVDGTPLQFGDRYFNTVDEAEYLYKSAGWQVNDSLAAIAKLADPNDPTGNGTMVGFKRPETGSIVRNLFEKALDVISTKDFLIPMGEGVDAYPALQKALDAAEGKTLQIEYGFYDCISGSPQVHSNTVVINNGLRPIIRQPNYYSWDRDNVPYNRALVVDWNGMWWDIGAKNIEIRGIEFRGPFWQPTPEAYLANPVQNWPANNGISGRGRDYQYRKSLPMVGESMNISIVHCHVEGFAEDAIQADNVTNFWAPKNTTVRCGRGGIRTIGVLTGWAYKNTVEHIFPGDWLNGRTVGGDYIGGNRAYGIEATRLYIAGCRPSENLWLEENYVNDCLQWKCMGTHGGRNIRFIRNTCIDGHHGIGVDKGGFTVEAGFAPPYKIYLIDNTITRIAPPQPGEGDGEGGAGHAIFITAHDETDQNIGRGLVVSGNVSEGWGCDNLNGGMWLGNWRDVNLGTNTWLNSVGSAIRLRDTGYSYAIAQQIITGVTRSAAGNQRGISVESGNISGTIAPCLFENTDLVNEMTGIFLSNNDGVQGFTIQAGHRMKGLMRLMNIGNNDIDGPVALVPAATGRVLVTGGTAVLRGANGVASVTYSAVGTYLLTVKRDATSTDNIYAQVTPVQNGRNFAQEQVDAHTVRVKMFLADGVTLVDNSFIFSIWSF